MDAMGRAADAGAFDQYIPASIEPYQYFLKGFDTPEWLWLLRGTALIGFVVVVLVYRHYRRKARDEAAG